MEVIERVSENLGYQRKNFSDEEILKRCIYPLVNIGAQLLDEGHALRAGDIDTVYVNGYGFPNHVGGPTLDFNSFFNNNLSNDHWNR